MASATLAITHIDAPRLEQALLAGIANVLKRRDYINKINVFPVPDGDTGTNLAFTLASVREAIQRPAERSLPELLDEIAEAALDGARGNSGAIMAQYFQGLSESSREFQVLDASRLALVSQRAAKSAWGAMSNPVPGTLPTVLEDFADEMARLTQDGIDDIRSLFRQGLRRARHSLASTPEKLAVLREAGVVDAGGQGFVDMLEGIWRYMRSGKVPQLGGAVTSANGHAGAHAAGPEQHRFCTECLVRGDQLDIASLRRQLEALDASSLVVAGGARRARVHIHTDSPGDVFRICADHGEIGQQKAEDMSRQHGLMNQRGQVAIVTDSAADLPGEEMDRLGINVVPVRLNFGDEEFLDKLSITPTDFYQRLAHSEVAPQTSQPPPGDFRRQFELLTSHGLEVLALQISSSVSGTFQAAQSAASRSDSHDRISVFDTLNGATGQGLMVLWAAEAAACGWERTAIISRLTEIRSQFRTFVLVRDLSWGVRGGRIKPWMEMVSRRFHLNLVLANTAKGTLGPTGVLPGHRNAVSRFARFVQKRMQADRVYRVMISHTDALDDARRLRDIILSRHPQIDACWIEDASPAIGCHAGPGALLCGIQPWEAPEDRSA